MVRLAPANQPPVLAISAPAQASVSAIAGEPVSFAAACTDPEGGAVTFAWSFPGGTPAASAAASPGPVTWATSGTFSVTCTCADAQDARSLALTRTVVVAPPLDQPAALQISVAPPAQADLHAVLSPAPEVQLVNAVGSRIALAGLQVTAAVGGGTGSLGGNLIRSTDAAGRALFDGISFAGKAAGTRTLRFTATGLDAATSAAVVVLPGPAALVGAASATNQTASPGGAVADPPAVRVTDADGNPVAGSIVSYAVTAGGGLVTGSPAATGADGVARVGSWTLGTSGAQVVQATAADLPGSPVDFTATARSPAAGFDITLRFLTTPTTDVPPKIPLPPTTAQRLAFERARLRIEQVITGDLPSVAVNVGANPGCGDVALGETVDDLLILVQLLPIDGPGNVLGQAGPCYMRNAGGLPVVGFMQFDTADLASLEARGDLDTVVLHEMLHVVGFGTIWPDLALLSGAVALGGTNPFFTGVGARAAFRDFNGGALYSGTPVPVENTGGPGTADGHWRESVFKRELMTGFLSGSTQPLSRTTAASLADLGYTVDLAQADPFDLASAALRAAGELPSTPLGADALPPIGFIDDQGLIRPAR